MDTYYIDWSMRRGIHVLQEEGNVVDQFPTLRLFLETLNEPSRIILEATFESFDLDERNRFIALCEKQGHVLLTTPTRATGKQKLIDYPIDDFPEYHKPGKFPDELAVGVIRSIARGTAHLKRPRVFNANDPWLAVREAACDDLMHLRYKTLVVVGPRGGSKPVSAKNFLGSALSTRLPDYDGLPDRIRLSLGKDGYSEVLVAATAVATCHVSTVRDFDKLSGLYAHGYGSQFRSDFHHWGLRFTLTRAAERATERKLTKGEKPRDVLSDDEYKQILRDYRYSCRWLYHQTNALPVGVVVDSLLDIEPQTDVTNLSLNDLFRLAA